MSVDYYNSFLHGFPSYSSWDLSLWTMLLPVISHGYMCKYTLGQVHSCCDFIDFSVVTTEIKKQTVISIFKFSLHSKIQFYSRTLHRPGESSFSSFLLCHSTWSHWCWCKSPLLHHSYNLEQLFDVSLHLQCPIPFQFILKYTFSLTHMPLNFLTFYCPLDMV